MSAWCILLGHLWTEWSQCLRPDFEVSTCVHCSERRMRKSPGWEP